MSFYSTTKNASATSIHKDDPALRQVAPGEDPVGADSTKPLPSLSDTTVQRKRNRSFWMSATIFVCLVQAVGFLSTYFLTTSSSDGVAATVDFKEVTPPTSASASANPPTTAIHPSSSSDTGNEAPTSAATSPVDERLNVVLFYVDDWAADTLGLTGKKPMVHTPHLDRLAREGQWFPNSYVTTSVCWQSRATLLTGMYVSVHRFFRINSRAFYDTVVQWSNTLFAQWKQHGYYVGFVGKWHAPNPKPNFKERAFDFFESYYGAHWMKRNGVRRHITELNQADAMDFLRNRPSDQKFALTVSFYATHSWNTRPYPKIYSPQPYTEQLYGDNDTIPLPLTATQSSWGKLPWFFTERNIGRRNWHQRGFDVEDHRQTSLKRLYRMAKEADDVVGTIVDELRRQGVYEKTLIVFTADNGNYEGEHQLAGKWYFHDESIRVPLILRDPRMPLSQRGLTNDRIVLNIDLMPTLLAAGGIAAPMGVQGRNLADLYLTPPEDLNSLQWRHDFFYEWNRGNPDNANGHGDYFDNPAVFGLIQKNWKYIYWPQTDYEQLFHLPRDLLEETDILNATKVDNEIKYQELRERYQYLKDLSQSGRPV
ncbi:hypothetical protein ACHAWF_016341 [Thalassiosira exigua]